MSLMRQTASLIDKNRFGFRCAATGLSIGLILLAVTALVRPALADESLQGIACRSVHLGYSAPPAVALYNEVIIDQSAPGTYFCVTAFSGGYCGLQELDGAKKVLIFSVWDPGEQNDPNEVADEQRVKLVFQDPAVRIGRFGNEGTGGQSFLDLPWEIGQTYRILLTAKGAGKRTEYTCHLYDLEKKSWRKLVTFSTLAEGKLLQGSYSFVEDFKRNRISATQVRSARFGNGWAKSRDGEWFALTKARFTADSNPVMNIDAGVRGDTFYLTTGGETANTGTPLGQTMYRAPAGLPLPDQD